MTESTDNTSTIPAPDLPPLQAATPTTEKPIGYESVSGPTQSVSSIRHNPINPSEKPCTTTTTTTVPTANEVIVENTSPKQEEEEEEEQKEGESTATALKKDEVSPQQQQQQQQQLQSAAAQAQQISAQQLQQFQQQQIMQHHQAQAQAQAHQQQQLLAAQMNVNNPMLLGAMYGGDNNKQNAVNKYTHWPPSSEQQYVSFHPLGWPIDADYQYQISNYLGPTAASTSTLNNINNMMAMQSANALNLGINPLIAAAQVQNPLSSLLAASAAFNPLLAVQQTAASNPLLAAAAAGNMSVAAAATSNGASVSNNMAISGKQYSLFVFHLPEDIDDHGLLQLFAPYGAMRSNVMRHDTGRSRGFGFVHFNTRHEAQIAIDMMNGHQIGRKRLRVSFKREEPHDKIRSNIGQPPMHQMPNNNQNINNVHHAIDPNDNKNDQ
eukprot:993790_1